MNNNSDNVCACCKEKEGVIECKNVKICLNCNYVISWYIPLVVKDLGIKND